MIRSYFKKSLVFGLLLSGSCYAQAQADSTVYFKVQDLLTQAKSTYAPDKRLRLIELTQADVATNSYVVKTTEKNVQEALTKTFGTLQGNFNVELFPSEKVKNKTVGVVNLSVANLRTKPDHAAEMATQVLLGAQVDILDEDSGDYRVRTPEGYIAWVPTSSIVALAPAEAAQWQAAKKLIYTAEFGRSYTKADVKSQRVSDLVYGDIVVLKSLKGNFYEVEYPDKRVAFIPKAEAESFVDWLKTRQPTAENVLASAKSMLGLPYLWGGTSVKGVDCSGFTKTSFFMNGYVIPRDASQQVLHGEPVDILDAHAEFDAEKALQNLKPADLLFFAAGKGKRANARVTHVALYIGNGTFIHAAGTVRINSMLKDAANYDDFQTRTVVAARRYLGSADPAVQKVSESTYYTK